MQEPVYPAARVALVDGWGGAYFLLRGEGEGWRAGTVLPDRSVLVEFGGTTYRRSLRVEPASR